MDDQKAHDLYDFMRQVSVEMAQEYNRIQARATEDPGTAGDQGEENWAELLREWLPRNYEVVTKGRIISQDGITSPQIDLLVLSSEYPKRLLSKKLYLAAGVVAAFECKTTLKASHINEAVNSCVKIKSMYPSRTGTPYKELSSPLVYGLLAHSHSWKNEKSTPEENIEQKLNRADGQYVLEPRCQLDLVCVADLAAWTSAKLTFFGPRFTSNWDTMESAYGVNGSATTAFVGHTNKNEHQVEHFTPIGVLVSSLSQKLAWENPSLRALADYYQVVNIAGSGKGYMRMWPSSIYSEEIRPRVEGGQLSTGKFWDEWSMTFM